MPEIPCPLAQAARRYGSHPALTDGDRSITYREYDRLAVRCQETFSGAGVREGDRAGLVLPVSLKYPVLLAALWRIKAVACPICPSFPDQMIADTLRRINARWVVHSGERAGDFFDRDDRRGLLHIDELTDNCERRLSETRQETDPVPSLDLDQPTTIILTSGTTSIPKAVILSFGNHYFSAVGANDNMPLEPGDRWLLSLPIHHIGGMAVVFRCLLAGATVVVAPPERDLVESLKRHHITHVSVVAAQLKHLVQSDIASSGLSRLKAVLVGGGSVPGRIISRACEAGYPVYTTYGLSEMASQVTATRPGDPYELLLTSGRLLNHRRLDIAADGEILVKGATLFRGYLVGSTVESLLDDKGWFHTGDIGCLDAAGYLRVTGRKDNMFVSGGENIYPEEIESALGMLDEVLQSIVVPVPDDDFGHRPVAFVRTAGRRPVRSDYLARGLARFLPRFKLPVAFHTWPEGLDSAAVTPERSELKRMARALHEG